LNKCSKTFQRSSGAVDCNPLTAADSRFIVNLPPEEQELVRVYWQVEQA
jgi:hypothetical protein